MTDHWPTAITDIEPNSVRVRGYDIAELMGRISFGQAVYLIIRGELPDEATGRLMESIIVASIDHGATPPSAMAARTLASTGATLSASVGAGLMSINAHHGGAIMNCALQLGEISERATASKCSLEEAATAQLADWKNESIRMSGFGHRVHSADPRTARLFNLAREAGAFGDHCHTAMAVEAAFASLGKPLPINVDGAMGAVLADLGFEPEVMNGLFMIARTPGLIAHVREEQTRMKPMRKVMPGQHQYDGPEARGLPS
ncbi:MAG: citryl-CoA lyase [Phycisphaerae bacterium]|nr:citryl-CoA lyase [Phycisphaerae bacterium]MBT5382840.1 citryl-CoA lyase [Phycisphaerae bacterium]MBT5583676.1 citryl-CoA lyase [Phycisphaerae bacterium]MBT5657160.1 citryl-CoA lyase [Phycisphaerae bacterium]MBT7351713.1 citryl-CoA lyase [Phycisphaerae bacterium]